MTIALAQVANTGYSGDFASVTVSFGSTPSNGDIILVWIHSKDGDNSGTFVGPTGFTLLKDSGSIGAYGRGALWYKKAGGSESNSYAISRTDTSHLFNGQCGGQTYTGGDTPDVTGSDNTGFSATETNLALTTLVANAYHVVFFSQSGGAAAWTSLTSGYATDNLPGTSEAGCVGKTIAAAGTTGNVTVDTTNWQWWSVGISIPPVSAIREQEGYRFRADDGSESAATWLASQDTAISRGKDANTRLRIGVNVTGDAPSEAFKLQYRKVGAGSWRDVPTGI